MQLAGWRNITAALHAKGTPVFLQLWHCGRVSHSSFHAGKPAVSASAIKLRGDSIHTPIGKQPYTQETAEAAIASGQADLIAFCRPYLSNPDLVERFANGWELNPPAEMKVWSAPTSEGYTDFPFHPRTSRP